MNRIQKTIIQAEILRLKDELGRSQAQIATQAGISSANITQILKENWGSISDELWRKVATSLNINLQAIAWQTAETANYKKVLGVCSFSQSKSVAKMIAFDAGFGKTYALQAYAKRNKNVFYLQCERHYTRKVFLLKLGKAMGLQLQGSISEMIDDIIERLKSLDKPLLILDEYDKILEKQGVFDLFKTFYDATLGYCGFVLCGTTALQQELGKRVKANKIGYVELLSRVGREYVQLSHINYADIKLVCNANGITDGEAIKEIRVQLGQGDMRQLKSIIEQYLTAKEL
jgi:DNA transposition AAA+ family ATPase